MPAQALVTAAPEIVKVVFVIRHIKARQLSHAEFKLNITAVGNSLCIVKSFGVIAENRAHFFLGFQIKLVCLKLHFVFFVYITACLDAEQNPVGFSVLFFDVVAVVCRHEPYADFTRDPYQIGNNALLLVDSVILKLNIKVILSEQVAVILGLCLGARVII